MVSYSLVWVGGAAPTTISGVLSQSNAAFFSSNVEVQGDVKLDAKLAVLGNATFSNVDLRGALTQNGVPFSSGSGGGGGTTYVAYDGSAVLNQSNAAFFASNASFAGHTAFSNIDFSGALTQNGVPVTSGGGAGGTWDGTAVLTQTNAAYFTTTLAANVASASNFSASNATVYRFGASNVTASNVAAVKVGASNVTASNVGCVALGASNVTASNLAALRMGASNVTASNVGCVALGASNVTASNLTGTTLTVTDVFAANNLFGASLGVAEVTASNVTAAAVFAANASLTDIGCVTLFAQNTVTATDFAGITFSTSNVTASNVTATAYASFSNINFVGQLTKNGVPFAAASSSSNVTGDVTVTGTFDAMGLAVMEQAALVGADLTVNGACHFNSNVDVTGSVGMSSNLSVDTAFIANVNGLTTTVALVVNGSIQASGDVVASSDSNLKRDLRTIPDALAKVRALTGYTFERVPETVGGRRFMGLLAQDVREVAPELVSEDPSDGHLVLAYGNVSALLVEAVKELASTKTGSPHLDENGGVLPEGSVLLVGGALSGAERDKAVWGVATPTGVATSGVAKILVTDAGGPLEVGDYVTTSGVPGRAMKQDECFVCNFTVAKLLEGSETKGEALLECRLV